MMELLNALLSLLTIFGGGMAAGLAIAIVIDQVYLNAERRAKDAEITRLREVLESYRAAACCWKVKWCGVDDCEHEPEKVLTAALGETR